MQIYKLFTEPVNEQMYGEKADANACCCFRTAEMGTKSGKQTRFLKRIWELNWTQKQDEVYLTDSTGELVSYAIFKFKILFIYDE